MSPIVREEAARDLTPISEVPVRDVLCISRDHGHAPGMAAILDAFPSSSPADYVGRMATIRRPDGGTSRVEVGDVRNHGATISLFFAGLTPEDVPIGSEISVDA